MKRTKERERESHLVEWNVRVDGRVTKPTQLVEQLHIRMNEYM